MSAPSQSTGDSCRPASFIRRVRGYPRLERLNDQPPEGSGSADAAGGVLRLAYQLMAYCRSCALVARLSLRFKLCRWVSTVFPDNPRASAASREDNPRPM